MAHYLSSSTGSVDGWWSHLSYYPYYYQFNAYGATTAKYHPVQSAPAPSKEELCKMTDEEFDTALKDLLSGN